MAYFFNTIEFPENSRMTGIWTNSTVEQARGEEVALGQLIDLAPDQDPVVESDFLSSHLPFHIGGFYGVYPDGQGWVFILQKARAESSVQLVGADDPYWVMIDSSERALGFNPAAGLRDALHWDHRLLVGIYAMQGVDRELVEAWSVAELLWGLLAECCHVLLESIVAGRTSGCAFPDIDHECEHDVFRDVFARWVRGELAPPEPGTDPGEWGKELQAQAGKRWTVKELKRLKLRDLKSMALEDGWERADIAGVKKSVLIELMVEGQTLPPDV